MEPLLINRRVLTCLCVYPIDESAYKWQKFACIIFTLFILFVHICAVLSGGTFFFKFLTMDLEQAIYSIFHVSGNTCMTYLTIASFLLRHQITLIFEKLSTIYDTSKILIFVQKSVHNIPDKIHITLTIKNSSHASVRKYEISKAAAAAAYGVHFMCKSTSNVYAAT